ncbi:MAG: alpha/beta hydrolase, partial [Pseudomonadota bacterium]
LLPEAVANYYVDAFSVTGFTGALNWYRNIPRFVQAFEGIDWRIRVPSLYVGTDNDVVLPYSSADGMEEFIDDLEKVIIDDCGHWTQQERPAEVARIIRGWLERKVC